MKPRRWLRFSLRMLLVLVVLAAIPMGWVAAQLKWIRDRREAIEWLLRSTSGIRHGGFETSDALDFGLQGPKPEREISAPWSLQLFSERGMRRVHLSSTGLYRRKEIEALFPEAEVSVYQVDDLR